MVVQSKRWGSPVTSGDGGGGANGRGTYAARPNAPAIGDTYAVTSGVCAGDLFIAAYSDTGEIIWRFWNRNHCNPYNSTGGWTQGNGGGANVGTSTTSLVAPDSGVISMAATGAVHDAEGPRIEIAIPSNALNFKFGVRALSRTAMTGIAAAFLFIRNSANTAARLLGSYSNADLIFAGSWGSGIAFPGAPGDAAWDGTVVYQIQYLNFPGSPSWGWQVQNASGTAFTGAFTGLGFTPSHVGVIGCADSPTTCDFTFTDFSFESYG